MPFRNGVDGLPQLVARLAVLVVSALPGVERLPPPVGAMTSAAASAQWDPGSAGWAGSDICDVGPL